MLNHSKCKYESIYSLYTGFDIGFPMEGREHTSLSIAYTSVDYLDIVTSEADIH